VGHIFGLKGKARMEALAKAVEFNLASSLHHFFMVPRKYRATDFRRGTFKEIIAKLTGEEIVHLLTNQNYLLDARLITALAKQSNNIEKAVVFILEQQPDKKLSLLNSALNPDTDLHQFFATRPGFFFWAAASRGVLKRLSVEQQYAMGNTPEPKRSSGLLSFVSTLFGRRQPCHRSAQSDLEGSRPPASSISAF
jgi:uncharacterized protein YbcI